MSSKITTDVLEARLRCRFKANLKTAGEQGEPHDYELLLKESREHVRAAARAKLLARHPGQEVPTGLPLTSELLKAGLPLLLDATFEDDDLSVRFDALVRVDGDSALGGFHYVPVLFHEAEKATADLRLLLGIHAVVLASVQGKEPATGVLFHGRACQQRKLKLAGVVQQARRLLREAREARTGTPPSLMLNDHCQVCEFRKRCQAEAVAKDDLSLLRGMSEQEIKKHAKKGITTVSQFSHAYQPGRRGKRKTGKARKHDLALQALAIREKKVYVLDSPTLLQGGVALYLDIEGVPDRGFEYLFGLLAVKDGVCTEHSFWADDPSQEKAAWSECLRAIEGYGDCTLYHYGQYESRFLDRMKRSAASEVEAAAIERIKVRSCNVLAAIYSHVYFPTWSNGLKDVGTFLGVRWSSPKASGVQSLAWRMAWEKGKDEPARQLLLAYNREDCLALRRVTEFVRSLGGDQAGKGSQGGPVVASVENIHPASKYKCGKGEFFCPELAHINKCAYADYQRDKVYLRTFPAMRQSLRRKERIEKKRLRVNQEITCDKPELCPKCCGKHFYHNRHRLYRKIVSDIKFTPSGVKRWVVQYNSFSYTCRDCGSTFYGDAYRTAGPQSHLGENLASWTVYNHVALRLSYEDIILNLNELFGFSFGTTVLHAIKGRLAEKHRATYEKMKDKLRRGNLIHADETKVLIKSHAGYVWAFTNMEEVVYAYTPTREGTILEEMLKGFEGVLVSDFYAAYDSPKCKQQKCFIHLMRDINDDIFHNPFDEELKQVGQRLVAVLRPIIETIDRFGLKRYHLNKHKEDVARYFGYLSGQTFASEVAGKYQKRLEKYRDKLFVFLDHDGIPWNNNNSENAIKRFASRRKIIGNWPTEKGLQEYLLFLSIYQTCRLKNLSFLRFLRSGLLDIDAFADGAGRRGASPGEVGERATS